MPELEEQVCGNCGKPMQEIPDTPMFICAYCNRKETKSGNIIHPGDKKRL